jgi:hypothetical protein
VGKSGVFTKEYYFFRKESYWRKKHSDLAKDYKIFYLSIIFLIDFIKRVCRL